MIWKFCLFALVSMLGINVEADGMPNEIAVEDVEPPSKVLTLRVPENTRAEFEDQYVPIMYNISLMTQAKANQTVVYLTGYRSIVPPGMTHHVCLYVCKTNLKGNQEEENCDKLFGWGNNAIENSIPGVKYKIFTDAGFAIDLQEYPLLLLQVHFWHPAQVAENTLGMDVVYQFEPPGYETRTLVLTNSEIMIPADTPEVFVDINCRVDTPVPIHIWRIEIHTHNLGSMEGVFVYNEERDEFRTVVQGIPKHHYTIPSLDHVVLPGEYLAARCTFNSTGQQEDTFFGEKDTDEMCRVNIKYKIPTQTHERFRFYRCLNTMHNEIGEKISRELPYDNMSIMEAQSYSNGLD